MITEEGGFERLVPFHGFSPLIYSLTVALSTSRVFSLIYSFPLLGDLVVLNFGCSSVAQDARFGGDLAVVQSPNPPAFTGTLDLFLGTRMDFIVPQLLSLPNGLQFRELKVHWGQEKDISLTTALVERCRSTLGTLWIYICLLSASSIDSHPYR